MESGKSHYRQSFRSVLQLLKMFWGFNKWLLMGNFLAAAIMIIIPFANAYIFKLIIDAIIASLNSSSITYNYIYLLLGLRLLTTFLQNAIGSFQGFMDSVYWTKFPIHLYQEILGRVSSLDLQHFENSEFINKLEKIKDSYAWKPLNILGSVVYGFQSLLQLIIATFAITILSPWLAIPILAVSTIGVLIQTRLAEASWGIWSDQSPYRKKFWYLSELLQGEHSIKEIKIFQLADHFLKNLREIYQKFSKENEDITVKRLKGELWVSFLNMLVYVGMEAYLLISALARKITVGGITYYSSVISNFQNGIGGLFRNFGRVYEDGLYIANIFEVLNTPPIILQAKQPKKITGNKPPLIEFKDVSFSYPGAKEKVLNHFSLAIKPGQKVAIVGENGAGKTTLIKLLARFYDVDEGEILVNGVNLKEIDLTSWYQSIGVLFQDFIKYQYSLGDNIYFGKVFEPKNPEEIAFAAQQSGANEVVDTLKAGYEQMLGKTFEEGVELSVGQWQKVALARGFLRNSPILILDEPTAAIDAKAEYEIFQRVEKLSKNKTVIIISHRFSTVRNADEIVVIKKGKVMESGNHEKLISQKGLYAKLFNLQAKGYK